MHPGTKQMSSIAILHPLSSVKPKFPLPKHCISVIVTVDAPRKGCD